MTEATNRSPYAVELAALVASVRVPWDAQVVDRPDRGAPNLPTSEDEACRQLRLAGGG